MCPSLRAGSCFLSSLLTDVFWDSCRFLLGLFCLNSPSAVPVPSWELKLQACATCCGNMECVRSLALLQTVGHVWHKMKSVLTSCAKNLHFSWVWTSGWWFARCVDLFHWFSDNFVVLHDVLSWDHCGHCPPRLHKNLSVLNHDGFLCCLSSFPRRKRSLWAQLMKTAWMDGYAVELNC